jgi:hypothetical protein
VWRLAGIVVALLALTLPGVAQAGAASSVPAVAEYTEALPTAGGAVTSTGVGSRSRSHALPAAVAARLRRNGATGRALAKLATSSAYGAPTAAAPGKRLVLATGPPPSVAGAVGRSGGGWSTILVLGLIVAAGIALAVFGPRARRTR